MNEADEPHERRHGTSWVNVLVAVGAVITMVATAVGTIVTSVHYFGSIETKQAITDATTTLKIDEIKALIRRLDDDRREDSKRFQEKITYQDAEFRRLLERAIVAPPKGK